VGAAIVSKSIAFSNALIRDLLSWNPYLGEECNIEA
jgi:hypothetical protein